MPAETLPIGQRIKYTGMRPDLQRYDDWEITQIQRWQSGGGLCYVVASEARRQRTDVKTVCFSPDEVTAA